jgi:uncharacterized protein
MGARVSESRRVVILLIMPVIKSPTPFRPLLGIRNSHFQTLWPGLMRRIPDIAYQRERIETPDDDFLDIDWLRTGNKRLVILTHGLEGSTNSQYMLGTAKIFEQHGWDVLAWNCRSCSGEMNRAFRLYYHGDTKDITTVVQYALQQGYTQIAMIGFSMGANITMKYLGTLGSTAPVEIGAAVAFSAPCDLKSGAEVLDRWDNWLYKRQFINDLAKKVQIKNERYPGRIDPAKLKLVRTWCDFDEWFSAPMCGYANADAFYRDSSSRYFIEGIRVPTLLVNALNDPILTPDCFPIDIAHAQDHFWLEMPEQGGHCGFMEQGQVFSWAERRALRFVEEKFN